MNPEIERTFIANTVEAFEKWCELKKEIPSLENFMIYCIKRRYVPKIEVKRAFVVNKVREVSFCQKVSQTKAIVLIEDEFGISERTQYGILKRHKKRHR